ncbi:TKL family protein kinase [Histomonas meleagridis]|uniref:TKL family protein kinase n=1 Tax=Histomonas meleagridis TaxID=135588 RepID=UPI003559437B|nr:TKL family protein kinase [Histomonas meleagridis]KAH0805634.1 TKL family protein kinase [Histomonas meleagridis]
MNDTIDLSQFVIRYEDLKFIKTIGNGAFGEVSMGIHIPTKQKVAIKKLHEVTLSPTNEQLYLREVKCLASLSHAFLLPFVGYTVKSPYCIITKYIPNGSLHNAIHSSPKGLSPLDKTLIAYCVALGMNYLHQKQMIHRDLKPQNILLDESGLPVICDFGTSRRVDQATMTGQCGTPNYMSPEFIKNEHYDQSVDVYSYGTILWEMLTEQVPFGDKEAPQVVYLILINQQLEIPEDCPKHLSRLIEQCRDTDPTQRPSFKEIVKGFEKGKYLFPGTSEEKFRKAINSLTNQTERKRSGSTNSILRNSSHQPISQNTRRSIKIGPPQIIQLANSYLDGLKNGTHKQIISSVRFFEDNIADIAMSKMQIWPRFLNAFVNATPENIPLMQKLAISFAQTNSILQMISQVTDLYCYINPITLDLFLYVVCFVPELITIQMINSFINLISDIKSSEKCIILLCKILSLLPKTSKLRELIITFFKDNINSLVNIKGGHLALRILANENVLINYEIISSFACSSITENVIAGYEVAFSINAPSTCFQLLNILSHIVSSNPQLRNCALECILRYAKNVQGEPLFNLCSALITSVYQFQSENALLLLCRLGINSSQNYVLLQPGIIELWLGIIPQKAPSILKLYIILLQDENRAKYLCSLPISANFISNVLQYGDNQALLSACWVIEYIATINQDFAQLLEDNNMSEIIVEKIKSTQKPKLIQYLTSALTRIVKVIYSVNFLDVIKPLLEFIEKANPATPFCLDLLFYLSKHAETHETMYRLNTLNILRKNLGKQYENYVRGIAANLGNDRKKNF